MDVDVLGFLAEPRAEEFREFRAHYPRCADCSAELRAWTELHGSLSQGHPAPEQLARYDVLSSAERNTMERHLRGCPACREELSQLASFDAAALRAVSAPAAQAEPSTPWGGRMQALGRVLWHPAFAYAALLLLAVPLLYRTASPGSGLLDTPLVFEEPASEPQFADDVAQMSPGKAEAPRPAALALVEAEEALPVEKEADAAALRGAAGELGRVASAEAEAVAPAREPSAQSQPKPASGLSEGSAAMRASKAAPAPRSKLAADARGEAEAIRRDAPAPRFAAPPAPDVLELSARGDHFELRVPLPVGTPPDGEVELRIASADGRRELRERVALRPQAGRDVPREVLLRVPRSWFAPGSYRVALGPPGGEPLGPRYRVFVPAR